MKYGSYPQNADFDDSLIEYEQWPIDCLTNNIVETLKVSLIERSSDNIYIWK